MFISVMLLNVLCGICSLVPSNYGCLVIVCLMIVCLVMVCLVMARLVIVCLVMARLVILGGSWFD